MAVYEIIIRLYFLAIVVASLFSDKARKWVAGRKNLRNELKAVDFSQNKWLWFLCSSYGEFQDGKYLIEMLRKEYPEYKILLTFFSSTGIELTKDFSGADHVCYLPLDTKSNAEFFVQQVKPQCVFFIRNDIWPNYIRTIQALNIPVFLAIFALNAESTFLKFPVRSFYRKAFKKFTAIFVQDPTSEKFLRDNKFNENIIVAGNSRIDRVIEIGGEDFADDTIEMFVAKGFCFVAGSTHIDDRRLFLETFLQFQSENIKWIIVPHEIDEREKAEAKDLLGEKVCFYTEKEKLNENTKLLWIDRVGILAQLYRYADIVFIGGGFDRGGIHSMIEPLVYGCPVCFGPENRDYKEVTDLIASGGAEVIRNRQELSAFVIKYKRNKELLEKVKTANKTYLSNSGGASANILNYLKLNKYV